MSDSTPFRQSDDLDDWLPQLRSEHPRLFFNSESWPSVKDRALNEEREWYDALVQRVNGYPGDPEGDSGGPPFERAQQIAGKTFMMTETKPSLEWGVQAMETAFVYLMSGEPHYLEQARRMLEVSLDVYRRCFQEGRVVNWYCVSRVCAIAACDWLFNDLTEQQRSDLLRPLLEHVDEAQPGPDKAPIHGINRSDHRTGFYGERNLPWFAGLVGVGDGIDDELALQLLRTGYGNYSQMLNFREQCARDDGGLASTTTGYALGAYSWASFNLFHSWKSAFGKDLASQWPHMALFPNWIMWNWIPAEDRPKEFGTGDTYHSDANLRTYALYEHMSQIMHFYGASHPDCAALAAYIRTLAPEQEYTSTWSFMPFLLSDLETAPSPLSPETSGETGRHFEGMGQVIMRSGTGPEDTYSLLTVPGHASNHRHFDENNFVIYRRGFLALDSGTRAESTDFHLRHYYAQTVAHNCVLIHMPDEPQPAYWGPIYEGHEGQQNHGGMNRANAGKLLAFETNAYYSYVASDATACYSDEKCELAVRQFLFLTPNHFVVFDRVIATRAEYSKTWLLHTQNEPVVSGDTFHCDEGGGRLFCRTLLPVGAELCKVGGSGREFWANGRNWEHNDAFKKSQQDFLARTGKEMLLGKWRMEISPSTPNREDCFLHVIQVGDESLEEMDNTSTVEHADAIEVRIQTADRNICVVLNTVGDVGGRIEIDGVEGRIDQPLAKSVMPQSSLNV